MSAFWSSRAQLAVCGLARFGGAWEAGAFGRFPAVAGEEVSGEGRVELLPSASGFFCRCGWGEEGSAVPSVKREAPDAGFSLRG